MRHLTWENFKESIIVSGQNRKHTIPGSPPISISADMEGTRLIAAIPVKSEYRLSEDFSKMARIHFDLTEEKSQKLLRISTTYPEIFREFYYFITNISDLIQLQNIAPGKAVSAEIKNLKTLLSQIVGLSFERQLGLFGELWLLRRLIRSKGDSLINSWTGPKREPHDFRLQGREYEVKSTTGLRRIHRINGLSQLKAEKGKKLFILSLQFGPAGTGDGISLKQLVSEIRSLLKEPDVKNTFAKLLEDVSYKDKDDVNYRNVYYLRTEPVLIPVNNKCPRISEAVLKKGMEKHYSRLESISYELNLEGLGYVEGSKEFYGYFPELNK